VTIRSGLRYAFVALLTLFALAWVIDIAPRLPLWLKPGGLSNVHTSVPGLNCPAPSPLQQLHIVVHDTGTELVGYCLYITARGEYTRRTVDFR